MLYKLTLAFFNFHGTMHSEAGHFSLKQVSGQHFIGSQEDF